MGNKSSEVLVMPSTDFLREYNAMHMKKIGNESLFTTTFNLYEAQMGSYSIRNEEFRNEAIEKLNNPFNKIETLQ